MTISRIILSAIIIIIFEGCQNDKEETDKLKKEKIELRKEISELKKENTELKKEISELKYGAKELLKTAKVKYDSAQYDECKSILEDLFNKHPSSDEAIEGKNIYEKISILEKNKIEEDNAKKAELEKRLNRFIKKSYDDFQKTTFYETARETASTPQEYGPTFQVEIYIGKNNDGYKWIRFKTKYKYSDWMFYKTVELLGDNGTQIIVSTEYPDKKTDSGEYGVNEWSDNRVDPEEILKLNESKIIKYRFDGQYRYTYNMNQNQRKAFDEIVERYKNIQ